MFDWRAIRTECNIITSDRKGTVWIHTPKVDDRESSKNVLPAHRLQSYAMEASSVLYVLTVKSTSWGGFPIITGA